MPKATFYVQIEPEFSDYRKDPDGEPTVIGAKAKRITQSKPDITLPNAVVVKLSLDIPASAFKPLRPSVEVVIPDTHVQPAISIIVEDPSD